MLLDESWKIEWKLKFLVSYVIDKTSDEKKNGWFGIHVKMQKVYFSVIIFEIPSTLSTFLFQVQEMLHICTDHYDQEETKSKDKKDKDKDKKEDKDKDKKEEKDKAEEKEVDLSSQQAVAVLGVYDLNPGSDVVKKKLFVLIIH